MLWDPKKDKTTKTARELGITKSEVRALQTVLGMLERGELVHHRNWLEPTIPNGFNMTEYFTKTECGTVGCIAGWSDNLCKTRFVDRHMLVEAELPEALNDLFSGPDREADPTTAQTAAALRNYLTIGEPRWREVMSTMQTSA